MTSQGAERTPPCGWRGASRRTGHRGGRCGPCSPGRRACSLHRRQSCTGRADDRARPRSRCGSPNPRPPWADAGPPVHGRDHDSHEMEKIGVTNTPFHLEAPCGLGGMSPCTAPVKGHRSAAAAASYPQCGYRSSGSPARHTLRTRHRSRRITAAGRRTTVAAPVAAVRLGVGGQDEPRLAARLPTHRPSGGPSNL